MILNEISTRLIFTNDLININENNDNSDSYSAKSPIECYKLNIVSVLCSILLLLSIIFNSLFIWVFCSYKEIRTTINMFLMSLTVLNLVGSILELPFVIASNYYCQ